MPVIKRVAIVGVGLMGASFGLALKRAWSTVRIIGVDVDESVLEQARARGAIDANGTYAQAGAADVILLALPVRQMSTAFAALAPHLSDLSTLVDVGSTKQSVIAAARAALGDRIAQFVPCHPIAGRERHGPMFAEVGLFEAKSVVITPLPENSPERLARVEGLWTAVGSRLVPMLPDQHDAVFAAVSHLPHMLAFSLVEELASRPNAKSLFEHAASGFRDFTRIASSSPEMWRDIALDNRAAILEELDAYLAKTANLRQLLADADAEALLSFMQRAQGAREHWLSGQLDQFNDLEK
jgi:prephenate dehydrogenase